MARSTSSIESQRDRSTLAISSGGPSGTGGLARRRIMPDDDAVFHDEPQLAHSRNILGGIAVYSDEVGQFADRDGAQLVGRFEPFCWFERRRFDALGGGHAGFDVELELTHG